jgi:mutator protein MutT
LSAASRSVVHVVAGAVTDSAGRVLIAQRPAGKHLAGGWEFPGGKLEPGEERASGLARELREELGITIQHPRPLIRVRHTYPSREILLDLWVVKSYEGCPAGLDGQPLRWCSADELAAADLLPADKPAVWALRLPERLTHVATAVYRICGSVEAGDTGVLRGVFCASAEGAERAARAGADFLAMRVALPGHELAALCRSVVVPVFASGIAPLQAWALGASGVNDIAETHARHGTT